MTEQVPAQPDMQPFVPAPPESEPAPRLSSQPAAQPIASGPLPASAASRPRGARWVNIALALAVAVAVGGVGFAAGRMTAPVNAAAVTGGNGRFFGNGNFQGGYFPGGFGGGNDSGRGLFAAGGASVEGTVESISGDTLTLKLANGATIQVSLSDITTYHAQAAASAGDVKTGGTVIVRIQLQRGSGATSPSASDVTIVP